jgi:type IV pilus assembly protein PilZ
MGIRFVWSDEARRGEFESVVEGLMHESLGPLLAQRLLRK